MKKVWIISVDTDTGRYTPSLTIMRDRKKWTSSDIYWEKYEDCLIVCKEMNVTEKRY